MTGNAIIEEEALMASTGYTARGHLERHLIDEQIPYFRAKGGRLWTTLGLIESAKLAKNAEQGGKPPPEDHVEFA